MVSGGEGEISGGRCGERGRGRNYWWWVWGERGAGQKLGLSEKIVFLVDWNGPGGQSTGFGVATNCHANGDKKEEKKKVMSFYLRAGGACFLYTHC